MRGHIYWGCIWRIGHTLGLCRVYIGVLLGIICYILGFYTEHRVYIGVALGL